MALAAFKLPGKFPQCILLQLFLPGQFRVLCSRFQCTLAASVELLNYYYQHYLI